MEATAVVSSVFRSKPDKYPSDVLEVSRAIALLFSGGVLVAGTDSAHMMESLGTGIELAMVDDSRYGAERSNWEAIVPRNWASPIEQLSQS